MTCSRIPVEDFCKDPAIWTVRLSPSGKKISFLAPWADRQNIFVLDVATKEAVNVTSEIVSDVSTYFWKSDRYLIYQVDSNVIRVDLESGKLSTLLLADDSGVGLVDNLKWTSDTDVLIAIPPTGSDVSRVYRVNVCSDDLTRILVADHPDPKKFGIVYQWIVNGAGDVLGAISVKGTNDYLLTRSTPDAPFKLARRMDFRRSIEPHFYSSLFYNRDSTGLYAITRTHGRWDKAAVLLLSAKTGRQTRCLYRNRRVDVESIGFSRKRGVATHVVFRDIKLRNKVLDREIAPVFKTLSQLPGDYVVQILDYDAAEKKFIVLACNDTTPGKYYLLDTCDSCNHKLILLGDIAPSLNGKQLAPVRPVRFSARDGLKIPGYLTLPVGEKAKRLPLVVYVHGGPENRNYWEFDSLYSYQIQFLANRGYAAFQLNFRGSIGYGRSFWMKGFRQHGRKVQDDVTDGVRWLIRRGIADPNRIAICGQSYGGYAALAGATFTPDLYAAAIDCSGVSNWLSWLRDFPPTDPLYSRFCIKVGDPKKHSKRLRAVAPVLHAQKITKPIFIAHGAKDQDVRISESEQMLRALRRDGKLVEHKFFPDESHIFESAENKRVLCEAMEAFLAKHLA